MKPLSQLGGIIPPLITPLQPDLSLDVDHTITLLKHELAGGVHGIFILGTTGESASLSQDVKIDLIRLTCREVQGKIPVLVGITGCSFVESLDLARVAEESGATALVAAPPYYMNIGQAELQAYYERLASEIPLPLMLYNMPSHTKISIEPPTVLALSNHPNIIGIKDSSGDMDYFKSLCHAFSARQEFRIFVGPEELLLESLELGGHGGVCGGANLYPQLYVDTFEAYQNGNLDLAKTLQETILFLSENLYQNQSYRSSYLKGIKAAMSFEGLCQGILAPPLSAYSDLEKEVLRSKHEAVKERITQVLTA